MSIQETAVLPDTPTRWDMSNVYAGLESRDYKSDVARLGTALESLAALFDERNVRRLSAPPTTADDELAELASTVIAGMNEIGLLAETLESYIHAFVTTNSYDTIAAREASKLEQQQVRRRKLFVRLLGWLGSLGAVLDELIPRRDILERHAFFVRDSARQSRYLMSEEMEALAAELCLDAGGAFGKLQGNVTSQLKVPFERGGHTELLPISVVRNFCFDPDEGLRRRAYEAEQAGWHSIRTTVAACLNGVKGTAVTLNRRRGRASVLEAALDENKIDAPTLDALLGAIREFLPTFRLYLSSKAAKLRKPRLAWWDIFAPVGAAHRSYTWREARQFIVENFHSFSDEMSDFAAAAFDKNWIDGGPRDGKRGGAFCMSIIGRDESRILANFDGSFEQVSTLAHELGHAYHNHCQSGLEPLRRGAPSTLAETASIFCETLVTEAALVNASSQEQLMILEAQLVGATQVCLDIRSRFLFETAVIERRAASESSSDDFCELMLASQKETYADAIDPATYHRYMWLWKPHYYSFESNFYNFPYAFGHLFALGLFAIYRNEGASFVPRYNELLRSTGEDLAAPLAARFGIDITQREFWRESLRIIENQVARYEALGLA